MIPWYNLLSGPLQDRAGEPSVFLPAGSARNRAGNYPAGITRTAAMPVMKPTITVIKRNPDGQAVMRYTGEVLHQDPDSLTLEASFSHADVSIVNTTLRRGDRFVETYYTERWYNIFAVHDRQDDRLKGWYCNIGKPAVLEAENRISYIDLALDLWVAPDGTQNVLDEEEFAALDLDTETRSRARAALEELQTCFANRNKPGLI